MRRVVNPRALCDVSTCNQVVAQPAGSAMFSEKAWQEIARSLRLSGRELQIVRGVFDDQTDLGIAQRIGVSLHTVHTHVERLHRKAAVRNRSQLLLRVMQEFLTLTVSQENDLPPICAHHAAHSCPFGPQEPRSETDSSPSGCRVRYRLARNPGPVYKTRNATLKLGTRPDG